MPTTKAMTMTLALCTLGAVHGCGEDGADPPKAGESAPPPTAGNAPQSPAYLVSTRVFTPDGPTNSFFQVLSSIEAGSMLDTDKALELPGSSKLFSLPDRSWFAIGDAESPTLTRYTVGADGALLRQNPAISLQPYGVDSFFSDKLYVVSPSKVYYPDPASGQLVIRDPQAMAVRGTIELPQTQRQGYTPYYAEDFLVRDGRLLFSVGWFDWEADRILPETGLVVVDTNRDEVVRFDVDPRCGGIRQPVSVASGDTYFVSSAMAASAFAIERYPLPPCALRVRAGEDHFDPLYKQELAALGAGDVLGEPVPAGGNVIFLRVLDRTLTTIKPETTSDGLASEPAWRWLRWDVGANQAVSLPSLPPATADAYWFRVGDRVFGSQSSDGYVTTTLIELNADGGPRPALSSPGFLSGLIRVR